MDQKIGMIGVGIMGSAMSANLLKAGYAVIGYDVDSQQLDAIARKGAGRASSCREIADQADVIIISLPSVQALQQVVNARDGLVSAEKKGLIVIETSTLPLEAKQAAHDALKNAGVEMLDCPLSGTGALTGGTLTTLDLNLGTNMSVTATTAGGSPAQPGSTDQEACAAFSPHVGQSARRETAMVRLSP